MALFYQSAIRNLPDGYTFRGATTKDLPTVINLFNQRQASAASHGNFNLDDLDRLWQTHSFNPAMDVRLVFDQREHLTGYIEVWSTNNPPCTPWLWGCVHPDYEGRGIGTALLRWAEARARLVLELLPHDQRTAARFGALHQLQTAHALCAALGWQPMPRAVAASSLPGALRLVHNSGGETASGVDIYEKELRSMSAQITTAA
jgi:GNAT superfamily N-acetyltransferase